MVIFENFKGNFYKLSISDFSSNALEKFLEWYPEQLASIYIEEILIEDRLMGNILNFRYNKK